MARGKCSRTGKQRFPSRLEAELAVSSIASRNSHHRRRKFREDPVRAYLCEFCGEWHMTSQSSRNQETVSS